jgi:hypothetical protein
MARSCGNQDTQNPAAPVLFPMHPLLYFMAKPQLDRTSQVSLKGHCITESFFACLSFTSEEFMLVEALATVIKK